MSNTQMLLTSAICNSKYKDKKIIPEFNKIVCFLSKTLIERSLISSGIEFQIFAPKYLIDCCVPVVL